MFIKSTERTARELVLEKHPTAFAHDSGDWVRIIIEQQEVVRCSECHREYSRKKLPDQCPTIGGAGNEAAAWEDAARTLKLK